MSNTVTVTEVRTSGWRTDAIVEGRYGNVVGSSAYGYWHLAIERVTGHGALYIGTIEESGRCLFAATQAELPRAFRQRHGPCHAASR